MGLSAWKRDYAKEPEIKLINRFLEQAPTNLKEHVALLARPGNHLLAAFPAGDGRARAVYSKTGLFNSDLFVVSGNFFYRYDGTTITHITGTVAGTGAPRVAWSKGIGYEYLFIADGTRLSYYDGGQYASGVLTYDGSGIYTADHVIIGGVHYSWGAGVTDPLADGSNAHPFVAVAGATPLQSLVDMLLFDGVPGVDFSSTLAGPNPQVTALLATALTVKLTARLEGTAGNAVTTTIGGAASGNLSFGATTLIGGGTHVLHQIPVPDAVGVDSITSLNGYVLVAVAGTQKFFYILPGEHTIDPLNFFEKESNPDPIIDMATVGDVAVIAGSGSTEYWSTTGESAAPLEPIQGRTSALGIVAGTLVVLDESTYIAVGSDGKVYTFSPSPTPVSNNGIEERIRIQLRREAGL